MPKRTYHPSKRKRVKAHGFMKRKGSPGGRAVLRRRIIKGRKRVAVK